MAQPLETTLKVDGLQEIAAAFQRLSQAAEGAFKAIENSAGTAAKGVEKIDPAIKKVEESFKRLAQSVGITVGPLGSLVSNVGNLGGALSNLEGSFTKFLRNTTLFAAAIAGIGVGFTKFVSSAANAADAIGETAQGVGLSADSFQKLSAAAADAGVGPEQFAQSLGRLSKSVQSELQPTLKQAGETISRLQFAPGAAGAAAYERALSLAAAKTELLNNATGKAAGPLGQLGIRLINAQGALKGTDEILLDVADAFSKMPDGIRKTALAIELFGRAGRKMIAFLNQGAEGIKKLGAELATLRFTDEQIKIGDKFAQQFLRMELVIKGVKDQLGLLFAPGVGALASAFTDEILKNFETLRARMFVIVKSEIEPLIQDLIRIIKGEPAQTEWVRTAVENFRAFGAVVQQALGVVSAAFGALRQAAQGIAEVINKVFGTNISGDALLIAAAILKITGALGLIASAAGVAAAGLGVLLSAVTVLTRAAVAMGAVLAAALAIPTGPILAALAVVVLAFAASSETVQAVWKVLMDKLKELTVQGIEAIVAAIKDLPNKIGKLELKDFIDIKFDKAHLLNLAKALGLSDKSALVQLFQAIPEAFDSSAAETKKKAEQLGKDVAAGTKAGAEEAGGVVARIAEIFGLSIDQLLAKFPELFALFDQLTRKSDEAANKSNTLAGALKGPTKGFEELGAAGVKAGDDIASALQKAQSEVKSLGDQIENVDEAILRLELKQAQGRRLSKDEEIELFILHRRRARLIEEQEAAARRAAVAARELAREELIKKEQAAAAERKAINDNAAAEKAARDALFAQRMAELAAIEERQKKTGEKTPGIGMPTEPGKAAAGPADQAAQLQQQLQQFTQQIQQAVQQAIEQIKTAITSGLTTGVTEAIQQFAEQLTEQLSTVAQQIGEVFGTVGDTISQAFQDASGTKDAFISNLDNLISKASGLAGPFTSAIDQIGQAFQNAGQAKDAFIQNLQQLSSAAQGLASPFTQAASEIGSAFQQMASGIASSMQEAIASLQELTAAAREAAAAAQEAGAAASGAGEGGGGGGDLFGGYTGGLLKGKGGIDKNLGMFTAGEYLMQRKATKYWGVGFMHMVNNMRKLDLARTLAGSVRGFNLGGLVDGMARTVPMPMPAMAMANQPQIVTVRVPAYQQGGAVERRVAVDLSIGGKLVGTVHTSEQTAQHLQRLSSHAKVVSTGAVPNWRR